jgi:thiol-disulfide isomerase/thioredoxin
MNDFLRRNILLTGACAFASSMASTLSWGDAFKDEPSFRQWPQNKTTPDWRLTDLQGQTWDAQKLKGRALLLNFWASWCEPCRSEMPSLELMAQQFEGQDLVVLAVNFRETDLTLQRFLQTYPTTLNVLRDRDGVVARLWGVRVFPSTIVIDKAGQARGWVQGEVDWTSARAKKWIQQWL